MLSRAYTWCSVCMLTIVLADENQRDTHQSDIVSHLGFAFVLLEIDETCLFRASFFRVNQAVYLRPLFRSFSFTPCFEPQRLKIKLHTS